MFNFVQDLRFGLRTLRKNPGVTLVVVLALALGIGANTTVFSIVDAVLLRSLPYHEPDRLVFLRDVQQNKSGYSVSIPEFVSWKENSQEFLEMTSLAFATVNLSGERKPEHLWALQTTPELLPILKEKPLLGRNFSPRDRDSNSRVILISYALWQRRFGGDPAVIGKVIQMNGHGAQVVGVLPRGLRARVPDYYLSGQEADLWLPLQINEANLKSGGHFLTVLARLKPAVSLQQARDQIQAMAASLREQGHRHGISVYDLKSKLVGPVRPLLLVLLAAVGLVLLIACANVANVLLARATSRQKEVSIRSAMGAHRGRLLQQLLTENLLVALAGGLTGLLLALFSLEAVGTSQLGLPTGITVRVDLRVLFFTLLLSLGTAILFGIAPALRATVTDVYQNLKEGGRQRGSGRKGRRLRGGLVVLEVTLSALLLIASGLLLRSFMTLNQTDMGFDPDHVLTTHIDVSWAKYGSSGKILNFYDRLLERVRNLPGVTAAGLTRVLPVPGGLTEYFQAQGHTTEEDTRPLVEFTAIKGDFFKAMGIPLLRGRLFNSRDHRGDAAPVAIVSRELARRLFPGQNPLGKQIVDGNFRVPIVGVVGDVKSSPESTTGSPAAYFPLEMAFSSGTVLVVRSRQGPLSLAGTVRDEILRIDPDQPIYKTLPLRAVVAGALARRAFLARLMAVVAGLALFLAAIGVYGVISYSVSERTQEVGIRLALGADMAGIRRLVLRQGLTPALLGMLIAGGASIPLGRVLTGWIGAVPALDPLVYGASALILVGISLLACLVPAGRAARVDPLQALRCE